MKKIETAANKYVLAHQATRRLENKLRDLEDHQLVEKKAIELEIQFAKRETAKLFIELEQCQCGESKEGHEFPTVDEGSSEKKSKICTKCGFEKK